MLVVWDGCHLSFLGDGACCGGERSRPRAREGQHRRACWPRAYRGTDSIGESECIVRRPLGGTGTRSHSRAPSQAPAPAPVPAPEPEPEPEPGWDDMEGGRPGLTSQPRPQAQSVSVIAGVSLRAVDGGVLQRGITPSTGRRQAARRSCGAFAPSGDKAGRQAGSPRFASLTARGAQYELVSSHPPHRVAAPPASCTMACPEGIRITGLYVYPVKSCAGIAMREVEFDPHGVKHDREWAVIDAANEKVLSQREAPALLLIQPTILPDKNKLRISVPVKLGEKDTGRFYEEEVPLDLTPEEQARQPDLKSLSTWNTVDLAAWILSPSLDKAASAFLEREVHVVRFAGAPRTLSAQIPPSPHPGVDPGAKLSAVARSAIQDVGGKQKLEIRYQDWFPLHFASEASLRSIRGTLLRSLHPNAEVNPTLTGTKQPAAYPVRTSNVDFTLWTPEYIQNLNILRFRPNVIFDGPGLTAFEEDKWKKLSITDPLASEKEKAQLIDIQFRCGRCEIPTMNKGKRDRSFLPNRVLGQYRDLDPLQRFSPAFGVYGSPHYESRTLLPLLHLVRFTMHHAACTRQKSRWNALATCKTKQKKREKIRKRN